MEPSNADPMRWERWAQHIGRPLGASRVDAGAVERETSQVWTWCCGHVSEAERSKGLRIGGWGSRCVQNERENNVLVGQSIESWVQATNDWNSKAVWSMQRRYRRAAWKVIPTHLPAHQGRCRPFLEMPRISSPTSNITGRYNTLYVQA